MSHPIGHHFTNGRVAFVTIPKNASSSIKMPLIQAGFVPSTEHTDLPTFAVVRDPVDRYWSGVREFEHRNKWFVNHQREPIRVWDEHTMHQHVFLMPFHDPVLVPLTLGGLGRLERHLDIEITAWSNDSEKLPNPYPARRIRVFYKTDVEMYEAVLGV